MGFPLEVIVYYLIRPRIMRGKVYVLDQALLIDHVQVRTFEIKSICSACTLRGLHVMPVAQKKLCPQPQ